MTDAELADLAEKMAAEMRGQNIKGWPNAMDLFAARLRGLPAATDGEVAREIANQVAPVDNEAYACFDAAVAADVARDIAAALARVRAVERERCADICNAVKQKWLAREEDQWTEGAADAAKLCERAIRAGTAGEGAGT